MSDPTPGRPTESRKRESPPMVAEEKEPPRDPKRIRLCLRAVVEASSKWRVDAKDLVVSGDSAQKRGGSADVVKAMASISQSAGRGDQNSATAREVAVKKFRSSGEANKRTQAAGFANELNLLSELDHDNIVKLIGFVEIAQEDVAWILLQWEENGNLREFVHSQEWVIPKRVSLIYDVTCGLHYLHSRDPPICHGDLKSLNILVNSQNRAVITDFGSARKLEAHPRRQEESNLVDPSPLSEPILSQVQERGLGLIQIEECGTFLTLTTPVYTLRWAAPEVLRDEEFSLASDMWAFAWICWEIMTGSLPFNDLRKDTEIILSVARGDLPLVTSNEHISQDGRYHEANGEGLRKQYRFHGTDAGTRVIADSGANGRTQDRITPTSRQRASEFEIDSVEVLCALGYTKSENQQNKEAKDYFVRALNVAESAGDAMAAAAAKVGQGTVCGRLRGYAEAETLCTAARETYDRLGAEREATDAIWGLAEVYRMWNEYSKAEASYAEVREISARLGAERDGAHAMWGLGEIYRSRNEYSKAEASYTEAREIYARLGADKDVAEASVGLGHVYRSRNKYSKAEASYTEAKEIYARLGAEREVADAIRGLGEVYRWRNEYSKAEASYTEAMEIYARLGDEQKVADAIRGLGEVYRWRNEYSKAEASYTEAKEIYVRLGAEMDVARAVWGLGDVYRLWDKYPKAEASYVEAKEIYARLGTEQEVADAIWGLGEVYRFQHEYSKAEASYTQAREIYSRLGAEMDVAHAIWGLAEVYRSRNKYSKAEASYTEARKIRARIGDETGVADAIWGLGEVYPLRKEYPKAKAAFIEARHIYTKTGFQQGVKDALSSLAKLPEHEGSSTGAEGFPQRGICRRWR
ncbi:hypothetical protein FRC04_007930 [Tulasnella sp. 424]|nr:hypothetical protein FRC04_007930 [Tulasnella sp. 424]